MKKDFFVEAPLRGKKKVYESRYTNEALDELKEDEVLVVDSRTVKRKGDKLKKGGFLITNKTNHPKEDIKNTINRLKNINPHNNFIYGYSFEPDNDDKRLRSVSFYNLYKAVDRTIYSEQYKSKFKNGEDKGIRITDFFGDAPQVKNEGLSVIIGVPSTSKNKPQYRINFKHFPVHSKDFWNYSTEFRMKPEDAMWNNIKYDRNDIIVDSSEIAAYWFLIKKYHNNKNKLFEKANLFPVMHRKGYETASKLERVVLDLNGELRRSPDFVRSLLMSRYINERGYEGFFEWSKEDGKLVSYKKA